uniref:Link domain-containing protein n=1 Tax=Cyclopterus lumpus TaxID=8103 RepID=A0A8C3G1W5_CYCLU
LNMIWLCITSLLSITPVISDQNIETSRIRAENQSIAGVFQVSGLNGLNQSQYTFNASDARRLCSSLGVNIASKAQVREALTRGLETCRFGWIDEHFAVIPRIKALSNCGQNRKGLVTWRAPVTRKFDVFCFNESGRTFFIYIFCQVLYATHKEAVRYGRYRVMKAILITSMCALLLTAIILLAYVKM